MPDPTPWTEADAALASVLGHDHVQALRELALRIRAAQRQAGDASERAA